MSEEYINPVRIMQWEVESGVSKSRVYLDGMLYSSGLSPEQMEAVYKIKLTELSMQARIRNYAEIFSEEDEVSSVRIASYNANQFFGTIIEKVHSMIIDKDVTIELDCEADDRSVLLDARRTKVILYNILSNSIIHSRRAKLYIKVRVYIRGDFLVIDVTDNGKCIRSELRSGLFDIKQRLSIVRPEDLCTIKGIGLAVSRKLARELGGDVVYVPSSKYNRFEITISQLYGGKYINEDIVFIADCDEIEMYMAEAIMSFK